MSGSVLLPRGRETRAESWATPVVHRAGTDEPLDTDGDGALTPEEMKTSVWYDRTLPLELNPVTRYRALRRGCGWIQRRGRTRALNAV